MGRFFNSLLMSEQALKGQERKKMQDAMVVVADNVAEYFFTHDKDRWDFTDFPNIAPPFNNMFIEAKLPIEVIDENNVISNFIKVITQFGIWVQAVNSDDAPINEQLKKELEDFIETTLIMVARNTGKKYKSIMEVPPFLADRQLQIMVAKAKTLEIELPSFKSDAKWMLINKIYTGTDYDGVASHALAEWTLYVKEDGTIVEVGGYPCFFGGAYESEGKTLDQVHWFMLFCTTLHHIALLTLSFMHCKNVNCEEALKEPVKRIKRGKVRAYSSSNGKPVEPIRYHTLNIEPMKKVLKTEGRADETGLKKAVHICRGHFKDYREHGLFGKYKGLYWWDMHVKGSKDNGIVTKDYNVKINKNN